MNVEINWGDLSLFFEIPPKKRNKKNKYCFIRKSELSEKEIVFIKQAMKDFSKAQKLLRAAFDKGKDIEESKVLFLR